MIAGGDQRVPAQHRVIRFRFLYGDTAQTVQAVGEGASEGLGHVLHDDDAGSIGRQGLEHNLQRLGTPGGSADSDHFFCGLGHGVGGGREDSIRGQLRLDAASRSEAAQLRRRCRLDRLAEEDARILEKLFAAQAWLGDDIDRSKFQGLQRTLRALLRQTRTDHHRDWMLRHNLPQERKAIHARHLDIERDYIRNLLADALRSDIGIGSRGDDLDLRIACEYFAERLAHYGGIVDDEDPDFRLGHKLVLTSSWSPDSAEAPELHFPCPGVEPDIEPCRASQARSDHLKTLSLNHL